MPATLPYAYPPVLDAANVYHDLNASLEAAYTGSQVIFRRVMTRAITLPANLAGSYAKAAVASTGTRIFALAVNGGAPAATITFTASATGTFSTQSAIALAAGDVVTITAPSSTDGTLVGIAIGIAGVLQ